MTAPVGQTLDCMIVGGHKCGTTSLKEYLGAHPAVSTHSRLEFTAFAREGHSAEGQASQLAKLVEEADGRLALAKHAPLYSEPFGLDRLREASPDCKVLLALRDPVARARSAFRMEALLGAERAPVDEVLGRTIEAEREGAYDWRVRVYLEMGCYGRWLGEILERFPRRNVMVVFQEEMKRDPAAAYESQCRWLGLEPGFRPDLGVRHNAGADPRSAALARAIKRLRSERNPLKRAARRALPESIYLPLAERLRGANRAEAGDGGRFAAVEGALRRYFEPDGEELARLLGRKPPWLAERSREE